MAETLKEEQARQQTADMVSIQKDVQYIKETLERNFQDHKEIKDMVKESLRDKVSRSRFRPVEMIVYGLATGIFAWTLMQILKLIETAQALF